MFGVTMGQCGITSSKTVLVFLNLIFWVRKPPGCVNNARSIPARPAGTRSI